MQDTDVFSRAERFILEHARLLERKMFQFAFRIFSEFHMVKR